MDNDKGYCINARNCLLLWCSHLYDTCFICNVDNNLRLQVKRQKRSDNLTITPEGVYGLTDDEIFSFESIGSSCVEKDEVIEAINWYKLYIEQPEMRVLDLKGWLFYVV